MKRKLSAESKVQTDALQQQQDKLQKLRESVESGLKDQNVMIRDPKMDGKKREIKMEEIVNDVIGAMDQKAMSMKPREIVFSCDDNAVSEV